MRIIALINQKGGCGKTTTAVNLSACLAHHGKKVLLIDLDPQGHASLALGVSPEEISFRMASVLSQEAAIEEILIKGPYPGLDLAPSNLRLAALEQQLSGLPQREERLLESLRRLPWSYDLIVIDAPPSLGLLSFNALRVADEVIVPVDASAFSLHGLNRLLDTLDLLQERTGQTIDVSALATLSSKTRFAQEVVEILDKRFAEDDVKRLHGGRLRTVIRSNTHLREATRSGVPIVHYDPHAIAAHDYEALAQEILQREREALLPVQGAAQEALPGFSPLAGGALFTWIGPEDVAIAGEFNDWIPDRKIYSIPGEREGENVQKWLPFAAPRSAYRLRIDGVWREDPYNPRRVEHPIGGSSSVLELSDSVALSLPEKQPSHASVVAWKAPMSKTGSLD